MGKAGNTWLAGAMALGILMPAGAMATATPVAPAAPAAPATTAALLTTPAAPPVASAISTSLAIQPSLGGAFSAAPSPVGATPPDPGWSGRGEVGLVLAQGNTQSSTVSLKLGVTRQGDRWRNALQVAALRATSQGTESAARFTASGQSDLGIREHGYWFGGLRYESDRFSGFNYQESASTGAGYRLRDSEPLRLSFQLGAGYRRLSDRGTDAVAVDTVAVAGIDYDQKLGKSTRLVNRTHAESGRYNTLATNYTGVEVQMNSRLGLSAGYDVRHNSEPPPGLKVDDAVSTVHLVYAF